MHLLIKNGAIICPSGFPNFQHRRDKSGHQLDHNFPVFRRHIIKQKWQHQTQRKLVPGGMAAVILAAFCRS